MVAKALGSRGAFPRLTLPASACLSFSIEPLRGRQKGPADCANSILNRVIVKLSNEAKKNSYGIVGGAVGGANSHLSTSINRVV
jgi:hypothetical protein